MFIYEIYICEFGCECVVRVYCEYNVECLLRMYLLKCFHGNGIGYFFYISVIYDMTIWCIYEKTTLCEGSHFIHLNEQERQKDRTNSNQGEFVTKCDIWYQVYSIFPTATDQIQFNLKCMFVYVCVLLQKKKEKKMVSRCVVCEWK